MSKKISINIWLLIGIIIIAILGGFLWGKKSVKIEQREPVYIKGDTVKIDVPYPVPVKVKIPCDTLDIIKKCIAEGKYIEFFPERVKDSIIYIPTNEDTLLIIKDWAAERFYEEIVYDIDTLGSALVKAKTQYNRLTFLGAKVTPVIKKVPYKEKDKGISPFVGVGLTTCPTVMAQGGVFINHWGGSIMYQYDWEVSKHILGMNFMYKF